jgi:hypothetical protein
MNPETSAAIIGVLGAIFLALAGNVFAFIYFAGKVVQRVSDIDRRLTQTEATTTGLVRDVATIKGREQLA